MVDKNEVTEELIKRLVDLVNENGPVLDGWENKSLQFMFADTNAGYWVKLTQNIEVEKLEKGIKDKADVTIVFKNTETLKKMLDKDLGVKEAKKAEELKVKGNMDDFLKVILMFGDHP